MIGLARHVLDQAMSEAAWTATVIGTERKPGLARTLGWTCLHVADSRKEVVVRRTGERRLVGDTEAAGLPDWLLIRDRVLFVELKRQKGKLRPAQTSVLGDLARAGAYVYVWRPSDWEAVQRVLTARHAHETSEVAP